MGQLRDNRTIKYEKEKASCREDKQWGDDSIERGTMAGTDREHQQQNHVTLADQLLGQDYLPSPGSLMVRQ